jgi:hypothetical protein
VLYNRRLKSCGFCGVAIPEELRFSPEEIAAISHEIAEQEESLKERYREMREENKGETEKPAAKADLANTHALWKTEIGIRTQSVLVITLVASWYWAFFLLMNDVKGKHSLFSGVVLVMFPFIAVVFTAILMASYFQSGSRHPLWVRFAVTAAVSIWLFGFLTALM